MRTLALFLLMIPIWGATNRTVTVKPSGGDYTSLAAAVAGESKDLVALDRQLTIECYAMQDTAAVLFNRTVWTTDATRFILVTVPPSERHAGVYSTSKYRLEVANAHPLQINHGVWITVEYVQVYLTAGASFRVLYLGGSTASASNITIRNSILRSPGQTSNSVIHASYTGNSSANTYIYNNLMYGGTGTANYGFQTDIIGNYYLWNNTVGSGTGGLFRNANGNVMAVNNLLNVSTTAASGTFGAGSGYNATNRASMGYTVTGGAVGDRVAQTFTFVDAGAGNYHLGALDTGALDVGVSNPGAGAYTNDVDGDARNGPWDIGFDEIPTASARRRVVVIGD